MEKKVKPEKIYIASRLTAEHPLKYLSNLDESIEAAVEIWNKGHYPYPPGWDFLIFMRMRNVDMDRIYEASIEWLKCCDSIFVLNGYHDVPKSTGVIKEVKEAVALGIKFYWSMDEIPEVTE